MKMNNNIIKTLAIGLIAIVLGSGIVSAAHVGSHGGVVYTANGVAEFKSGSIEGGDFVCWNDNNVKSQFTEIVSVAGDDYVITYHVTGSGAKITGCEKVVTETPVVDETPVDTDDDTGVQTETTDAPAVDEARDASDSESKATDLPVVPKNNEVVVPEPETAPVETEPVTHDVPQPNPDEKYVMATETATNNTEHASGDDVTVAPATNNTIANETVENETANNDVAGIVMQKAGNPIVLSVIAIFLLIGAVAYKRY